MKRILLTIIIGVFALSISANPVFPPTLISPVDSAIDQMPDAVLNWGPVATAISYKVQIDKNPAFNTADLDEYITNLSGINAQALSFGEMYYWRVKSIGSSDTSDWSVTWSFVVLDTVSLHNPVNNNTNPQDLNAIMSWYPISGISFYEIEADTVADFSSPILQYEKITDNGTDTVSTRGDNLAFGAQYFWRVRAAHSANNKSSWCQAWKFTTKNKLKLTGPANNASNRMPDVTISWTAFKGVSFYEYELALDTLFTNPATYVTDSVNNQADELLFGSTYYLRARAVNDNDISDWSDVRQFSTLESLDLVSPANNSTNISIRPLMKWKEVTGITSYQLQYADNPAFNNAFEKDFPADQTEYQVEGDGLDSATVYHWRVRALHSKDTTAWSDVWNYKIAATGINDFSFDNSEIHIYPNPASEKFFISLKAGQPMEVNLNVMDLLGQVLISKDLQFVQGENTLEIGLENLNQGIYLVKLQKDNKQFVSKIVIDK
jgi:hypothetical protein